MKKALYTILFVLTSILTYGQTANTNYQYTVKYKTPITDGQQSTVLPKDKIEQIVYFDGQGRPVQSIAPNAGGSQEEIISVYEYDIMGRQAKKYLPYATNSTNPLDMVSGIATNLNPYYQSKFPLDFPNGQNPNPYSEAIFENSPSGKLLKQGAPGSDWKVNSTGTDHTVKYDYAGNLSNEVYRFDVNFIDGDILQPRLVFNGYYNQDELLVQISKNENWVEADGKANTTESFIDKSGKTVLVRTYDKIKSNVEAYNTYYVYDDFGNLSYVISPKGATDILVLNTFSNFLQTYDTSLITPPLSPSGTGGVTVTVSGLNLKVDFNTSFSGNVRLKTGYIVQLATSPQSIPDMFLGYIGTPGAGMMGGLEYRVYVKNGYLYITGSGYVQSLVKTFNAVIPEYSIDTNKVDALCYQYKYDGENRMVEKKIPGKGWEYVVYDKLNRPVLTQDANLRSKSKWLFVKYDALGRVVYSGQHTDTRSRAGIQSYIDDETSPVLFETRTSVPFSNSGTLVHYTNNAFPQQQVESPNTPIELFSVVYYDNYDDFDTAGFVPPSSVFSEPRTVDIKTLVTGSKVRTLETTKWTTNLMAYDKKARPISVQSKNDYLQTTNVVETKLDFLGNVIQNKATHSKTGVISNLVKEDFFTYDQAGRLEKHTQKLGSNAEELISYNKYNDLGQLVQQKVGDNAPAPETTYTAASGLQTVDYGFNVRGWMTTINDPSTLGTDLFAYEIKYNKPTTGTTALYNGNISQTFWKTANDSQLRNYSYSYDNLNRIKTAKFSSNNSAQNDSFNLNTINYDKNGNILFMHSAGDKVSNPLLVDMDKLTYEYNGNQLLRIAENGVLSDGFKGVPPTDIETQYNYDANGNLTKDRNKDITAITYNHLNQPLKITFGNVREGRNIVFTYNAAGVKECKVVSDAINGVAFTYYAGGYTYQQYNLDPPTLQYVAQPQGYAYPVAGGGYKYVYQYKDQVGNVRLSYTKNGAAIEIVQENNYSPFGMKHEGYGAPTTTLGNSIAQKYKFNGKESEEALGLNVTEMDFRQYDPTIGRFFCVDLLAESSYGATPYHFTGNNPIIGSDPTGLRTQEREIVEPRLDGGAPVGGVLWRMMQGGDMRDVFKDVAIELHGPNAIFLTGGGGGGGSYDADGHYLGAGGLSFMQTNYMTGETGFGHWQLVKNGWDNINAYADADNFGAGGWFQAARYEMEWVSNGNDSAQDSNIDVSGVINAGMGIVGGAAEIVTGVVGEAISGGLSTALIIDGVYRIGTNSVRMGAYLSGEKKLGDAVPGNAGAMAGKIIDGMNGAKFGEVGTMQNVLGFANDAAFFYYTGGNLSAYQSFTSNPNWVNTASLASNIYTNYTWFNAR